MVRSGFSSLVGPQTATVRRAWDRFLLNNRSSPFQSLTFCDLVDRSWPGRRLPRHLVQMRGADIRALIPAYLYGECSRLDFYRAAALGEVDMRHDPILLSHSLVGWHGFPVGATAADTKRAIGEFSLLASRDKAVAMFAGIPKTDQASVGMLQECGYEVGACHTMTIRSLSQLSSADSTTGLPKKKRSRVRNDLSRARRAGTMVRPAKAADHPHIIDLLAAVRDFKGTPESILPDEFVEDLLDQPPRGLEAYVATDPQGRPVGTQLNLRWRNRYIIWLAGHYRETLSQYRQSHALYVHSINRAKALGLATVEAGRDPYPVKKQHGFEQVELLCAVKGSSPTQHSRAALWARCLGERHRRQYREVLDWLR